MSSKNLEHKIWQNIYMNSSVPYLASPAMAVYRNVYSSFSSEEIAEEIIILVSQALKGAANE